MMKNSTTNRRIPGAAATLLSAVLLTGVLAGCDGNLSETDVLSRLEAAGLTVERLSDSLLTRAQRQRIESKPEQIFSVKVSDADGQSMQMTLVEFDKDWKAESAKNEGVPGFVVKNWFFAGVVTSDEIQRQIEAALQ